MLRRAASRVSLRSRERKLERFLEVFQPGPQTTVVDVGVTNAPFGQGSSDNFFEARYPWPGQITAVGHTELDRFEAAFPAVRTVRADGRELPFADGEFDLVVAAWMLYHVPDLERGIGELARVLRPGGRLVAVTNSRLHLIELRELVGSGPSTLSFARETGESQLAPHFDRIRREDVDGTLTFADRVEVEAYVRASIAMSPFVDNLPDEIDEPFIARRANSIFVAEKP
jgi:SAM-dependent methyltransferase